MGLKCSTILVSFRSRHKDEQLSMPHPEESVFTGLRPNSTNCWQIYDTSLLSAKRVPTRTWPRSQVVGPPCLLRSQSRFVRPPSPAFPPEVNIFRFLMIICISVLSTINSSGIYKPCDAGSKIRSFDTDINRWLKIMLEVYSACGADTTMNVV